MNNTDAAQLVAYLNRAGLIGAMEGQAAVWADALADVPAVTAQQVVRAMVRDRTSDQRWVTPGDIRAAARQQRRQNLASMASPQPPQALDGDPTREVAWQREYRTAYGDTGDPEQAMTAACAALNVQPEPPVIEAARRPPELHQLGHDVCCIEHPLRERTAR